MVEPNTLPEAAIDLAYSLLHAPRPSPSCPRTQFKDVGKGWYSLAESRQDTYDFSKLKRLMVGWRTWMQPAHRSRDGVVRHGQSLAICKQFEDLRASGPVH